MHSRTVFVEGVFVWPRGHKWITLPLKCGKVKWGHSATDLDFIAAPARWD